MDSIKQAVELARAAEMRLDRLRDLPPGSPKAFGPARSMHEIRDVRLNAEHLEATPNCRAWLVK